MHGISVVQEKWPYGEGFSALRLQGSVTISKYVATSLEHTIGFIDHLQSLMDN
jgi:hypothetical protein